MHSTRYVPFFWKERFQLSAPQEHLTQAAFSWQALHCSNGWTHSIRRKSEVNKLVTKEMTFLLLSCISVSCISDSQEVRRKERIFSKAGESECPAVQIRPWGEPLMLQWVTTSTHEWYGWAGVCCVPGQETQLTAAGCTEQEGHAHESWGTRRWLWTTDRLHPNRQLQNENCFNH